MNTITAIIASLVLVGAVFMAAAITHGRKIRASVPAELQRKWHTMICFMIFFIVGYVLFAAVLLGNFSFPHELITSPIFLGGAIFVFIVVNLTRSTIGRMKGAEEKLWNLNESLERMVEARTKELMEAQEELVRREKLTMLGIVAGNVGNELRNPLGVMSNAVFFLESQLTEADESVREHLEIITKEIDGSKRVLADFVDFFRTRAPRMKKMSVEELIHQSLAEYTMPENITVSVQLPEALPAIKIDPSQMKQVFRNLVTNAVQAMPEGGALRVAACRNGNAGYLPADTPVPGVQIETLQEPAYFVEINIADSGPGISPENMVKVFQPLFTTKSRGIGLGLSICKNLVEVNGGRIAVSSEPGTGSVFTIRLPIEKRVR